MLMSRKGNEMTKKITSSPIILYLIGLAGTGKLTIAHALQHVGFKIIDNHLINDPIFRTMNLNSNTIIPKEAWAAVGQIRNAVLKFITKNPEQSLIFTNELIQGSEGDSKLYKKIERVAKERGSIFIPVRLLIALEERNRRITSEERRHYCKKVKVDRRKSIEVISISHPNLLNLDVTTLSAHEAAREIKQHIISILQQNKMK